jgi:hypothetical protein
MHKSLTTRHIFGLGEVQKTTTEEATMELQHRTSLNIAHTDNAQTIVRTGRIEFTKAYKRKSM